MGGDRTKCQPRAAKSTMTESRQQCCCSSSLVLVSTLSKLFRFRIFRVVTIQVVTIQITAILVSQYDLGQMFRCGELCEERRRRSRNIFAPSGSYRVLGQDCLTLYLETQNFAPRLVITVHYVHFVKYDDAVSFYDAVSDTIRRRGGNRGIFTEEGVDTVAYFGGNHGSRV